MTTKRTDTRPTVSKREQAGRNVRLTMSNGYQMTLPPAHPLSKGADSFAAAAKQAPAAKTAEEWLQVIRARQARA